MSRQHGRGTTIEPIDFADGIIDAVNLSSFNLNLLVSLHALLGERSVTRAAKRCGVTQSSMSYALAKLRARFDDPLLERRGGVLEPTPLALSLAPRLESALGELRQVLDAKDSFDPRTSARRFRIASSDMFQLVALPSILEHLISVAPQVDVVVRAESDSSREQVLSGALDIAIDSARETVPPGIAMQELFRQHFVCVSRRDHPQLRGRLDLATFSGLPHVLVARDEEPGLVDRALEARGRRRHVAARVPDYAAVGHIIAGTSAVAVIPQLVAVTLAKTLPLRLHPLPLALRPFGVALFWQKRRSNDPGLRWLRGVFEAAGARLSRPVSS